MGVLAGLIALAATALPVIEESTVTLRPSPLVGPSFETYSVVRVPPHPPTGAFSLQIAGQLTHRVDRWRASEPE